MWFVSKWIRGTGKDPGARTTSFYPPLFLHLSVSYRSDSFLKVTSSVKPSWIPQSAMFLLTFRVSITALRMMCQTLLFF